MPRYYFHVFNDEKTHDDEGIDLPDDNAARDMARQEVIHLAAHSITTEAHLVLHHRIEIEDAAGLSLGTVTFGDVVEIRP